MNVETQRKNIVHRILDVENEHLLTQIEALLDNDIYAYTTSGNAFSATAYKNHVTEIIKVSDAGEIGYTTEEARKKISRK